MALIDLSNYATTLHQASSASFTNGNVFFDTTGVGKVAFGDASTYATYTPTAATSATTLGNTAPDLITRAAGNFAEDGWRAGMKVTLAASATNDATYEIESISTDGLTITTVEVTITTESGSGDETLAGASTTNALINLDGLRFEAAYAFENQERRLDEVLRAYDRFTAGTFKFGGAYDFVNGRIPNTDADRKLLRGSGWRELTGSTVNRIYFGPKGLGSILAASTPYYQTSQFADVTATDMFDFTKLGNVDEAFQVFGDATNGNFDNTLSSHYFSIRTYGQNFDRISTGTTLGIAELGGYSSGMALNQSNHLTTLTATYPFLSVAPDSTSALTSQTLDFTATECLLNNATTTDNDWVALGYGVGSSFIVTSSTTPANNTTYVISTITTTTDTNDTATTTVAPDTIEVGTGTQTIGNVQVTPFTGMDLEKFGTTQSRSGFTQADGDFFWAVTNTVPGNLNQVVAFLDVLATLDSTINTGTPSYNGKAYDVWYEYTPSGDIRPISGAGDGFGLWIENITGTDQQRIELRDDDENVKTYPISTPVTVELGQNAIDDTLAWFHTYLSTNYNTGSATEYDDSASTVVKGDAVNTSAFITGANTYVAFNHDFSTDGSTNVVFLCEGDGGVTQQKTAITLADTTVSASCVPAVENNV
jgi:hypothetical protein